VAVVVVVVTEQRRRATEHHQLHQPIHGCRAPKDDEQGTTREGELGLVAALVTLATGGHGRGRAWPRQRGWPWMWESSAPTAWVAMDVGELGPGGAGGHGCGRAWPW
jgi:hypothetical protein